MLEPAEVEASAHDATVLIENNVAALSAALEEAQRLERANARSDQVERLRAKLVKQRGFVAETEAALDEAEKAAAEYREGTV